MEEFVDVPGLEGKYQVSLSGYVKSICYGRSKILRGSKNINGYIYYGRIGSLHRLLAKTFIPNIHNKDEVNHIDGDTANNNISNLEWVTKSEQHWHRHNILGKKAPTPWVGKFGKDNPGSKCILQYDVDGNLLREWIGIREIDRCLGINQSSITKVCKGKVKKAGGFIWKYKGHELQ